MGDFQVRLIDGQIVVEEDVDVDGTVGVRDRRGGGRRRESGGSRFPAAAQLTLDGLGDFEELAGGEGGLAEDHSIEEFVGGFEAPGLGLNQRGLAKHQSYFFTDERYGLADIGLSVTEIATES